MPWVRRHQSLLIILASAVGVWLLAFSLLLDRALHPRQRWDHDLHQYAQRDATNPPPPDSVLFVGSSSIRLWDSLRRDFPRYQVFRRGLNGARLHDTLRHADQLILPYQPGMIVLYGGDNDLADGHSPASVLDSFQQLVGRIRREFRDVPIGILSVKPSPSRWHLIHRIRETNRRLRVWCQRDERLKFIDVHTGMLDERGQPRERLFEPDGLHPSSTGYACWADAIRPHLPTVALKTEARSHLSTPPSLRHSHDRHPPSRPPPPPHAFAPESVQVSRPAAKTGVVTTGVRPPVTHQ